MDVAILIAGKNMARTRTARRTTASSEIEKDEEIETPSKEVELSTEQEQLIVPSSEPSLEGASVSTDEEVERSTEREQTLVFPQEKEGRVSTTSDDTEGPAPEIEGAMDSPTYSSGFGWVIIDGKKFENDVVVLMDGSVIKRDKKLSRDKKAKYGHTPLTRTELLPLLRVKPDLIVIGTGQDGAMPITPKAQKILNENISFIGPTPEALNWMQKDGRKTVALLHVTC